MKKKQKEGDVSCPDAITATRPAGRNAAPTVQPAGAANNDIYSDKFESKMDKMFRSNDKTPYRESLKLERPALQFIKRKKR